MLKRSVILATIIALVAGTFGMPISTHTCRAAAAKRSFAASTAQCACATKGSHPRTAGGRQGNAIDRVPCCSTHQVVLRAAGDAVAQSTQPAAAHIAAQFPPAIPCIDLRRADARSAFRIAYRPPLPQRAQSAYLYNSAFLI